MANEPLALAVEPDTPNDDEYEAFCAALLASARGRAFLAEHARRARAADTGMLLSAIDRLETLVHPAADSFPADSSMRAELCDLLDVIRGLQAEIDIGGLAMQVAKLASLVDVVQQRIEAMVAPASDETPADEPHVESTELALGADDIFADEPQAVLAQAEPNNAEAPAMVEAAWPDKSASVDMALVVVDAPQESASPDFSAETPQPEQTERLALAALDALPLSTQTEDVAFVSPDASPPSEPLDALAFSTLEETLPLDQPEELAFASPDVTPPSAPPEEPAPASFDMAPPAVEPDRPPPAAAVAELPAEIEPVAVELPAATAEPMRAAMPEISWDERPVSAPAAEQPLNAQPVVPPSAAALAIAAVVEQAAASVAVDETPAPTVIKAGTMPPPAPFEGEDFSSAELRVKTIPPANPFAPIMALSDDERTALFT